MNRPIVDSPPLWSVILPTYRRPDVLELCFEALAGAIQDSSRFEILVYDNGLPDYSSKGVEAPFRDCLTIAYTENEPGHGLGYSLSKGAVEAKGEFILELNDDAIVPDDIFERIEAVFSTDKNIGVVGVRALEEGYQSTKGGIGEIDARQRSVRGNFDKPTSKLLDVEHVYGFCYAYRRELIERGCRHDRVLLAQDYSSGNRIETDHCLTAISLGYRVVYDGRIAVKHLAKPRADLDERTPKWKLNHIRNTLYLFLKHFGLFGRNALALRFAFFHDIGIRTALRHPSAKNWIYFLTGLRGRVSAFWHWLRFKVSR